MRTLGFNFDNMCEFVCMASLEFEPSLKEREFSTASMVMVDNVNEGNKMERRVGGFIVYGFTKE